MDVLKELRHRTGAPIVDCKKAIQEAQKMASNNTTSAETDNNNNNTDVLFPLALDWLRSHGATKATTKVAGRTTTQGLVGLQIAPDGRHAALVHVASETDFAALSTTFVQLVQTIVTTAYSASADRSSATTTPPILTDTARSFRETLLQLPVTATKTTEGTDNTNNTHDDHRTNPTVRDCLQDAIVAIRENISIAAALPLPPYAITTNNDNDADSNNGVYAGYVHNKVDVQNNNDNTNVTAGTAAAIVLLVPTTDTTTQSKHPLTRAEIQDLGKQLAMHIVAAKPLYLSVDDIPADVLDKERDILQQQLQNDPNNAKKPPHIIDMIVQGKLQKYYEGVVLLEQPHMIVDDHPKIQTHLQHHGVRLQRYEYRTI